MLYLFLVYVPIPQSTSAQGVLWLPEDAMVRAESSGMVEDVLVEDGDLVKAGQALFSLSNPELLTELQSKMASFKEYKIRHQQAWTQDRSQSKLFEEDLETINQEIRHLDLQVQHLIVQSNTAGRFKMTQQHQMLGSFVHQGDTLGVIINNSKPKVRVALKQQEIGLVRSATQAVRIILSSRPEQSVHGEIIREVPGGSYDLPSAILGTGGGGQIVVDKGDAELKKPRSAFFSSTLHCLQKSSLATMASAST